MLKKLLLAAALCVSLVFAAPATAEVISPKPGLIVVEDTIYSQDFLRFYRATLNPAIKHYRIILHTNGGDAFSCVGIINRIKELKAKGVTFTTESYGISMSAGTYFFMMGDERIAHPSTTFMFHGMIAQMPDHKKDEMLRDWPGVYNMQRRMDDYVKGLLMDITGWSQNTADYWIDGGKAQFMSGETAINTGFATRMGG